ncbi:FecR domain-containing protein [Comamonas flocculans]|uniref:LysM peptidoglycan-binding domain-containing protein n=1 Tax=Comamonas flocculans TaxID=2597701 RepID=A0A5B8RZT4_9BURK|nr:FecR domain-containing protein [Comamonas flocculans]QEA13477.1 LysM peptidoglycan-binding domain-containing protein [Comamonas flocculans]
MSTRTRPPRKALAAWPALAALTWALPQALAAQTLAGAQDLTHQVVRGDTLHALAARYLDDAAQWPALAQANRIANPRRLQPGSVLHIPRTLQPWASARVQYVRGDAQAALPGKESTSPVAADAELPEGTRLQLGPDAYLSIRLSDGSIVRVHADSDLQLQRLRKRARPGSARSVLELQRGRLEPSVTPDPAGQQQLDIHTPHATASVRGTRFSVQTDAAGRTLTAVSEGMVAVRGGERAGGEALLQHGWGAVVDASGRAAAPVALLAAPDARALPSHAHDADFLRLKLPPVQGARAYQVQLARDPELTEVVRAATAPGPELSLPAVADGNYHLAVRAIDTHGLPGQGAQAEFTVKAHPIAPLYQSPQRDAHLTGPTVQLQCTRVAEAARYRIQLATNADFDAPLFDATSDGDCQALTPTLAPGRYLWRMASLRALDDGRWDQGPYAEPQGFTLLPEAPSADALRSRQSADAATVLSWPARPGQRYRLQLAREAGFATLLVDETLEQATWSAAALPAGHYFVRLRSIDASGLESAFSAPHVLSVIAPLRSSAGQAITSGDGTAVQRP